MCSSDLALGACVLLLVAAFSFGAGMYKQKCHACRNYQASLRIMSTMKQKVVQLAVENRNLEKQVWNFSHNSGVVVAKISPNE